MKGVLKGFKYISQIFDEDQEGEMQIGLPTDVKHVAHIGMDGPSSESPSWLKDYKAPERPQSAPLDSKGDLLDHSSDIKTSKDTSDIPKPSRRHHSADNLTIEPPDRKLTSKSKGSRRHHRKDSSEGSSVSKSGRRRHHRKDSSSSDHEGSSRSGRITQEMMSDGDISEAPSPSSPTPRRLPGIPKSSRRKKSKEDSSRSSKSKASSNADVTPSSATIVTCNNESCQISSRSSPPFVGDETGEMVVGCQNSA